MDVHELYGPDRLNTLHYSYKETLHLADKLQKRLKNVGQCAVRYLIDALFVGRVTRVHKKHKLKTNLCDSGIIFNKVNLLFTRMSAGFFVDKVEILGIINICVQHSSYF